MLAFIGLTIVVLFLLLWRFGILDDLSQSAQEGGSRFEQGGQKRGNRRLEVYRKFLDQLSGEDEKTE